MKVLKSNWFIAPILFTLSGLYYYLLSAKIWTWMFVTGDSGDWLLFCNEWAVPQPFGSPLFISTIRLLGWLFPNVNDYQLLVFSLAVIPAAIIVVITYFIAKELTGKHSLALVASAILMGMSIFLTQAIVLEQYMFTAVFIAIAYLMYIKNKLAWATIFLGLGTASHIIVGIVALFWFVIEWKRKGKLLKLVPLYILFGILPYGLILYLLATSDSLFYTGGLSLEGANVYLGGMYQIGNLSLVSIPRRILDVITTVIAMLGLAIYPLAVGLKRPWQTRDKIALAVIGVMFWFWFSNNFFSTFKYMAMACPILAAYAALGLSKLEKKHLYIVATGALALIMINPLFYNADKLAHQDPQASEFYKAVWELPDKSAVLSPRGGAYGFSFFYALSEGKDLVPLLLTKTSVKLNVEQLSTDYVYSAYIKTFEDRYGYKGQDCIELAKEALEKGDGLYFISSPIGTGWEDAYTFQETENFGIYKVTEVKVESWEAWILQLKAEREAMLNQ